MDQLKTIGLKVFYIVLKQHRAKLPKDLREFGDQYVKEEFRQANQKANKEQYIEFLERWAQYIKELDEQQQKIGRDLDVKEKEYLNEEQLQNLEMIKKNIK